MNILVFDLGTTNFKATIFNENGTIIASTLLPTPTISTSPDHCEILPKTFQQTLKQLLKQLYHQSPNITKNIDAITFATQTNSFILLDKNNDPLTPIILWSDNRALESPKDLLPLSELSDLYTTTGVPSLSHQFMIAKIAWLHKVEPLLIERAVRLCLISDYLTLYLTGQHVTEAGAAGLTGLLDIHTLSWWQKACAVCNIPLEWLPHVVRAGTDLGTIDTDIAHEFNFPVTCRFIVGCLDQYAGAIGVGNITPGGISETTGTVLATLKCTDTFQLDTPPGIFQGPSYSPGTYYQMTFGSTAANWLEEYRDTLEAHPPFVVLDEEAAAVPPGADDLLLSPDTDPITREAILTEYTRNYSRGHAVRTILEAVSYALADQVSLLCGESMPDRILCAGGAARSQVWLQIKANVLNCAMVSVQCPEPTSLGAAILAIHALSDESASQVVDTCAKPTHSAFPEATRHQDYITLRSRSSNA